MIFVKKTYRTYSLDTLTMEDKRKLHFVAVMNDAFAIQKALFKKNFKFTVEDLNLLAYYLHLQIGTLEYALIQQYFYFTDRDRLKYIITYNKIIDLLGDDYTGKVGHIPERMYIDYIEQRQEEELLDLTNCDYDANDLPF